MTSFSEEMIRLKNINLICDLFQDRKSFSLFYIKKYLKLV